MAPLTRLELKQLQHLSLRVDFEQPQLLLQLAQLPALTHLALQYDWQCEGQPAVATASAWPMLPQLRELEIDHDTAPGQPQWEAVLAGVAAATGLTRLELDARMLSEEQQEFQENGGVDSDDVDEKWASEVAVCARLANLTGLQDLTINGSDGCFRFRFNLLLSTAVRFGFIQLQGSYSMLTKCRPTSSSAQCAVERSVPAL
jgi:hypothetical protein